MQLKKWEHTPEERTGRKMNRKAANIQRIYKDLMLKTILNLAAWNENIKK